jgi:uncharacterized protein (TIGR01319 family)
MAQRVTCVDVGSTYTKAAVVEVPSGALLATSSHPTTVHTDVMDGLAGAVRAAGGGEPLYVCSSAGGGLRLAVVGYEKLVSAEAAHRVALSAGAQVVHVAAGPLTAVGVAELRAGRPDVVLLVGGTDGGDADVLRHNASRLARSRWRVPVVLAGNAEARDEVLATLTARGVPATTAANVLPRIGELNPAPARAAIRDVFLRHVIGGKRLSRGTRFARLVRGATPDVVLAAVELFADQLDGDLLVVDVGGATTDVYSAVRPDAERTTGPAREVAGTLWRSRTVEGDLGVRWSAPGVVAAARAEKLLDDTAAVRFGPAAADRSADPSLVPDDSTDDLRLATLAATVALRRHARGEPRGPGEPRRGGRDLSGVRLAVGSGGVLRHARPERARAVLGEALGDAAGGWALPDRAQVRVDAAYVLAPAGLLAEDHPEAAIALMRTHLYEA